MKLTFLGAGQGGFPTSDGHSCAAMLECGNGVYLVDAGAPVLELMTRAGVPFEKLKGVFTTHMHGDHTFGLLSLCSVCSWHYTDAAFDVFMAEERGIAALKELILSMDKIFCEERIRLKKAEPGVIFSDGNITVTAIPTTHCHPYPSYAYMIEGEGKRIFFSGDLHHEDASDFPRITREESSDLIVCEMAHADHDVMLPMLGGCPAKMVLFNHVSWDRDEKLAAIKAAEGKYPMPILAVGDGETYLI